MAARKNLSEDIAINNNFKLLTRSYQEHAIGQINFARNSVLGERDFAKELSVVFTNVKTSYSATGIGNAAKNPIQKNGRELWILISSNNKLYGDIVRKTSQLFIERFREDSTNKKIDIAVIGRQGKNFIDESGLNREYKYFELPDSNISLGLLKDITTNIVYYENVVIFHGKYTNLVTQTPVEVYLTGDTTDVDESAQKKQAFLFEPSIEEIYIFFENQILSILLNQTLQEAQLARFASRINAMETAQINIQKQLEMLKRKERMLKNMEMNKKQLELLSGRSLWARK